MKKILSLGMMLAILLCSFSLSFGTDVTTPADEELTPKFVAVNTVTSSVTMSGSTAEYYVMVIPHSSTGISYIDATLKLVNGSGTTLKTTTDRIYNSGTWFKLADSKKSVPKGSYHAEYTLKVYKSGKLLETIKGKSLVKKYS